MENPYQAPAIQQTYGTPHGGEIASMVIETLRGTKGWVRFMAVLGFISCAFLLLGSLGIFAGAGNSQFGRFGAGVGLVYLLMTGVYFYLAFKLNQYASRIGAFLAAPDSVRLASALDSQRSFWKCLGIMAIIFISLYIVVILFLVVAFQGLSGM